MIVKERRIKQTIKKCMLDKLHFKQYIKILRENKNFKPIQNNRYCKNGFSLQFQKESKTALVIPKRCGVYHIQIHLDKYFQLVKLMKIKRDYRTIRWERLIKWDQDER